MMFRMTPDRMAQHEAELAGATPVVLALAKVLQQCALPEKYESASAITTPAPVYLSQATAIMARPEVRDVIRGLFNAQHQVDTVNLGEMIEQDAKRR